MSFLSVKYDTRRLDYTDGRQMRTLIAVVVASVLQQQIASRAGAGVIIPTLTSLLRRLQ